MVKYLVAVVDNLFISFLTIADWSHILKYIKLRLWNISR